MKKLEITHDAGFFSCCSKRLEAIVAYFNTYKTLPGSIDSSKQFSLYKNNDADDAIAMYFASNEVAIPYRTAVSFHNDMQFLPYQGVAVAGLQPFIKKYFSPSQRVQEVVMAYEKKYAIAYDHICAVYYRGNDKHIETAIAPHEVFIAKAREVKKAHPKILFLVQTDEAEFLETFLREFPDSITFDELRPMRQKDSFVAAELDPTERVTHGVNFFASILVLAKCHTIVTHSGNGALWSVLYRGNTENVFQWLNGSWNPGGITPRTIWQKNKRYVKKLLRIYPGWSIV